MHKIATWVFAALCLVSCASAPAKSAGKDSKKGEPAWVSNPRTVYAENQFVSAVGSGTDRDSAEKNALSALVAVFGQSVKGETTVSSRYSQALKSGKIVDASEDSSIDQAIQTSVDLETVVGAEIKDTWYDGSRYTYAVAVMDKMKATMLYANLLDTNEKTITGLIAVPQEERNTFDAYARYDLAAEIGDTNASFLNVLSVISPATADMKRSSVHPSGDEFRLECVKIAQAIPVAVTVAGDRDGRIKSAFSAALSAAGFKTGGNGSRYTLDGSVSLTEAALANQQNKFVRYLVDAKLTDTKTGNVLLPYSINGREGHATLTEAENRALRVAEQKIKDDYNRVFKGYLAQLSAN